MPYAVQADMVARFGQAQILLLADRDNDQVIDTAVVESAIADADAVVDLHVRRLYAVPLAPVPAEIARIVCDMARRYLYGDATEVPDSVLAADKAARDLLKLIADGKVQLDAAPAAASLDAAAALEVDVESETPFFTGDSLKAF